MFNKLLLGFMVVSLNLFAQKSIEFKEDFNRPFESINKEEFSFLLDKINSTYLPVKEEGTTRYFFVRHGQSVGNLTRMSDGQTLNLELTPKGVEQAENLGKQFRGEQLEGNWRFDAAISSPMKRAVATAQAIIGQLDHKPSEPIIDKRVVERHAGNFEGKSKADPKYIEMEKVSNEQMEQCATFWDKLVYKYEEDDPLEENIQVIFDRIMDMIDENESNPELKGKTILVATHAVASKSLFVPYIALKFNKNVNFGRLINSNASFFVLDVKGSNLNIVRVQGYELKEKN